MSEEKKECDGCGGDCHCEHEHQTNAERMAEHLRREELVENIKVILQQQAQREIENPRFTRSTPMFSQWSADRATSTARSSEGTLPVRVVVGRSSRSAV